MFHLLRQHTIYVENTSQMCLRNNLVNMFDPLRICNYTKMDTFSAWIDTFYVTYLQTRIINNTFQ